MGKRSGTLVEHGEEITGLTVRMIHKEFFLNPYDNYYCSPTESGG